MDLVEEDFPFEESQNFAWKTWLSCRKLDPCIWSRSGGNYYFWNELTDEVYVMVQPLKLPQILKLLEEGKLPVYRHVQQV